MPLPNDASSIRPYGLELEQHIGPKPRLRYRVWPATGAKNFLLGFSLPRDGEDVSVRERLDIVVHEALFVGELEVPDEVAVPCEFLNAAAMASDGEHGHFRLAART